MSALDVLQKIVHTVDHVAEAGDSLTQSAGKVLASPAGNDVKSTLQNVLTTEQTLLALHDFQGLTPEENEAADQVIVALTKFGYLIGKRKLAEITHH